MSVLCYGGVQMPDGRFESVYAAFANGKGIVYVRGPKGNGWFYPLHADPVEGGVILSDGNGNTCVVLQSPASVGWGIGAFGSPPLPLASGQVQIT